MTADEVFSLLEQHPYRLANLQREAGKRLNDSEALGGNAVRLFAEVVDTADKMLAILGQAGEETAVFESRLATAVGAVAAAVAKSPLTAERRSILDPFFAACGYVPQA